MPDDKDPLNILTNGEELPDLSDITDSRSDEEKYQGVVEVMKKLGVEPPTFAKFLEAQKELPTELAELTPEDAAQIILWTDKRPKNIGEAVARVRAQWPTKFVDLTDEELGEQMLANSTLADGFELNFDGIVDPLDPLGLEKYLDPVESSSVPSIAEFIAEEEADADSHNVFESNIIPPEIADLAHPSWERFSEIAVALNGEPLAIHTFFNTDILKKMCVLSLAHQATTLGPGWLEMVFHTTDPDEITRQITETVPWTQYVDSTVKFFLDNVGDVLKNIHNSQLVISARHILEQALAVEDTNDLRQKEKAFSDIIEREKVIRGQQVAQMLNYSPKGRKKTVTNMNKSKLVQKVYEIGLANSTFDGTTGKVVFPTLTFIAGELNKIPEFRQMKRRIKKKNKNISLSSKNNAKPSYQRARWNENNLSKDLKSEGRKWEAIQGDIASNFIIHKPLI